MPKSISVYFLPSEVEESQISGASAIMVDLLRASTTISHALGQGARDVIPAGTPTRAQELRDSIGRDTVLLCGERLGVRIEGFDLGNSPLEYTRDVVANKRLVFASSNGSSALLQASSAARLAVGCLNNVTAVAHWAAAVDQDCFIVCAGKLGQFAADDAACAGQFVMELERRGFVAANDAARTARRLAEAAAGDWHAFIRSTDHGRYLLELGFAEDLGFVCRIDSHARVPIWHDTSIALADADGHH